MSPEKRREFEAEWPALSRRLHRLLSRKNIPEDAREDLVQDVALRLLTVWDKVDRARSPWPFTATIALNLIRDGSRSRRVREVLGEVPEAIDLHDVEQAGIARLELERVRRAMANLTVAQRGALLSEVGAGSVNGNGQKMLRLRARRRLHALLERVSAVVLARFRKIAEGIQGAIAAQEGLIQASTCIICILVGFAGAMPGSAPTTSADVPITGGIAAAGPADSLDPVVGLPGATQSSVALRPDNLARSGVNRRERLGATANARSRRGGAGGSGSEAALPSTSLPSVPLPVGPGGDQPVDVPDAPQPPAAPDPPSAATVPDEDPGVAPPDSGPGTPPNVPIPGRTLPVDPNKLPGVTR